MKHDFAFTSTVAHSCIALNDLPEIIRRKSDNCGTQYKSRYVFGEYQKMASQYERKVIIYYGPSGHGKGLVDAMSVFGVKGPLLKAVVTNDFKYSSSKDIYEYMKELFKEDKQKVYFHIPVEETVNFRCNEMKAVPIPGCVKESHHMICFKPDGSILTKINIMFLC